MRHGPARTRRTPHVGQGESLVSPDTRRSVPLSLSLSASRAEPGEFKCSVPYRGLIGVDLGALEGGYGGSADGDEDEEHREGAGGGHGERRKCV